MEIKVIESKKSKFVFEMPGEDHTICNALRDELWNDSEVKASGYHIEHPLVASPKMVVETTTKKEAKKAVMDAIKRLKKNNDKILKEIAKIR